MFELVSPILKGEKGLEKCHKVLEVLNDATAISLNISMAMHLHIGVERLSLASLKNICDNFIKYEDVIDTFMPVSRRNNRYCKSNKAALMKAIGSKKEMHEMIQAGESKELLFDLVNPLEPDQIKKSANINTGVQRYYKLNLQNLNTGKRPTIEFRQHSATSDFRKVEPWVRFCMAFVNNSISYVPPAASFDDSIGIEEEFDELFDNLIGDPALKTYYKIRREELRSTQGDYETESTSIDESESIASSRYKDQQGPIIKVFW
jgi:hypothetical protein